MSFVAALLLGLFFSAPPPEEVNQAAQRILGDDRYQASFPEPGSTGTAERQRPRDTGVSLDPPDLGVLHGLAQVLLWVLIVVVVVVVFVWLVRHFGGYEADVVAADAAAPSAGPTEQPVVALGDVEALAAEGRFGEAIHLLWLYAVRVLNRHETVAGSLTSREILAEADLAEEPREAVGSLVRAVEVSLFGGRVPGEGEYRTSLDAYRRFATAQGDAGGAA